MPCLNLIQKLDRYPPVIVRLLARRIYRSRAFALSDAEVAARAGLTVNEVRVIAKFTSWNYVSVDTMLQFLRGCGADFNSAAWQKKNAYYMVKLNKIPPFLTRHPDWGTTFEPLLRIAAKILERETA